MKTGVPSASSQIPPTFQYSLPASRDRLRAQRDDHPGFDPIPLDVELPFAVLDLVLAQ